MEQNLSRSGKYVIVYFFIDGKINSQLTFFKASTNGLVPTYTARLCVCADVIGLGNQQLQHSKNAP